MKNKLFWPIVLISIVIIVESLLLLTRNMENKRVASIDASKIIPTNVITKEEDVVSFDWIYESGKATLVVNANKDVSVDAFDLYIKYKNVKVDSVKNSDELQKPTFSKISTDKSLVVMNYYISDPGGFKMNAGQSVKIAELIITQNMTEAAELSISEGTQVVENGTVKVLPFSSKNLIINSSL